MSRLKQEKFVLEYAKSGNATQAAIRAGYSERTAAETGSRLIRNPQVKAKIDAILAEKAAESGLTVMKYLCELEALSHSTMADVFDFSGDGVPKPKPANQIPARAIRAMKKLKYTKRTDPRTQVVTETIEVELYPKTANPLEKVGTILKMDDGDAIKRIDVTSGGKPLQRLDTAESIRAAALALLADLEEPEPGKAAPGS